MQMKNKISFTSVLKNKNGSRQINSSSNYSTQSQNRTQKLIDIYQQFELYPDQDYTLDFSAFRNMAHRSRNGSINMIRSRNVTEDPEIDLQSWIQNQKIKQNQQSQYKTNHSQKGFKINLNPQNDIVPAKRSKSNLKKPTATNDLEYYQQQNDYGYPQNINQYKTPQHMEESNKMNGNKHLRKGSINFKTQPKQRFLQQSEHHNQLMIQSSKRTPQQYLALQPMKERSQYPEIQQQDYKKLQDEFQKIKAQKIAQLCMNTKKSANKQKIQQIIASTIQNIHKDIQAMAQQIVAQKKLALNNQINKKNSEEQSQEMLISNREEQKDEMSQSQEQLRQQKMKNMIKGYINGIQEAKSQGKNNSNFSQQKQHNNYFHQNTFNNEVFTHQPSFENISTDIHPKVQNINKLSYNNNIQSVGYSFSSNNMICEHSFSKQLGRNSNFHQTQTGFQKNHIQPPIYEPQDQDDQVQQKISLPYIEEVKSDCGDFPHQNLQVQSSEQIQFKRKKMQNITLDISGKNIKNIESVHYEPPVEQNKYNNELFRNFQKSEKSSFQNKNSYSSSSAKQNLAIQAPKFVSKTFNSYLSGQKRLEYGQKIVGEQQTRSFQQNNSNRNILTINPPIITNNYQFATKISPITKYQPSNSMNNAQKINQNPNIQPTKKPSIQLNMLENNKSVQKTFQNSAKFSKNQSIKPLNQKMYDSSVPVNQSSFLSLNQSVNDQNNAFGLISSSKNLHQLQSKKKFSINSPIMKVQDQLISPNITKVVAKQSNITQFTSGVENNTITHKRASSYAISTPIQQYQVSQNFKNKFIPQNSYDKNSKLSYACSESIVEHKVHKDSNMMNSKSEFVYKNSGYANITSIDSNQVVIKNSILQMQPLKISVSNYNSNNFKTLPVENYPTESIKKSQNNFINQYPGPHKVVESHQNNDFSEQNNIRKNQSITKSNYLTSPSSGKNFLQALNTKQSIQIDLPNQNFIRIQQSRQSFATQTFRPSAQINANQSTTKSPALNQRSTPTSKTSITRITLKSSDKSPINSPKVISLTVNNIQSNKAASIKPFNQNQIHQDKENIFQKLTIKEGPTLTEQTYQKKIMMQNHSPNMNMQQSIKISQNINSFHKTQTHVDNASKQNTNTLNQSGRIDMMKSQSMKFDLNIDSQSIKNPMKQSLSIMNKTPLIQKKQPLLKLSKNLGTVLNPSISISSNMNMKKSVGQSIKLKYNQPSTSIMMTSKGVKSSLKGGVKQSIGNDSDMDFDLELD